ncbi:alpha/beta hydrolase [Marinobacter sp. HL-58]|uniref:alpha/beta hydrolase n=1 Tax=Marinobacter sp. HL-58 TaxID=1479237 RepID=UPI0004814CDD|nr:alpha/beta hydrolase [Marinobacter sp. HL-58]KPP98006.1 MAG: Esterase/lipase [Marinobacter sp. HL-58]
MIWFVLVLLLSIVLITLLLLRGENLAHLDRDDMPKQNYTPSPGHNQVLETIKDMGRSARGLKGKARLMALRKHMDGLSEGREFVSEFRPSGANAPNGEWVLAPGVNTRRRILYIHGGAWVSGSPRSHRTITDRLSKVANAAVFAVDYRLLPENRYREGLRDCQQAYQWILEHGPDGPEPAEFLVVAGDSAGGSHTLVLIAWIRDQGLRQADAAIALSPSTDLTLTAPSNRLNIKTDPLLGPTFGSLMRVPLPVLWWLSFFGMRLSPSSPLASPLRGSLENLPPTLIHASDSEMLLDNARRYANKARDSGSPVELKTWPGMVHVWHIFPDLLPEAEEAFEHIGDFLNRVEKG